MPSLLTRASNSTCSPDRGVGVHTGLIAVGGKLVGASLHAQTQEKLAVPTSTSASSSSATGCGLGPEWLAKSQLRSTLPTQALQNTGYLNVSIRVLHCVVTEFLSRRIALFAR